jgi:sulfide:quinone oxidoreductase
MKRTVLVLGAGFGGLELTTLLSEALGDQVDVTLIDKNDGFMFGYSKLDVMFERERPEAVHLPYRHIVKPGVTFRQETIVAIEPDRRRVTTDGGTYEADVLVVALGSEYDFDATPGLAPGQNEFYTLAGATRMRDELAQFTGGRAVIGVSSTPFKCPPAPCETALLLHDLFTRRGIRARSEILYVTPFGSPIPPSPATSQAVLAAFAERGIQYVPGHGVSRLDTGQKVAVLDDGSEIPYDLFFGVPRHRVPAVVTESGMEENRWIPVDPATLRTRFEGVYAIGDVMNCGIPMAGVFAEGAARTVAAGLIAEIEGTAPPPPHAGAASCYLEYGAGLVGRIDIDFLSGPSPASSFSDPSDEIASEKRSFGATRRARWFGLD